MIDRTSLRYFLAVVEQGGFTKAARHCRVSQPTLSVAIAKLEREVGGALFLRSSRRVELTGAGTRFLVHARRIEAEFAEAERAAHEEGPTKLIRIGVVTTLPAALVQTAVGLALGGAPGERIELVDGSRRELLARMGRGRVDAVLGLVSGEPQARQVLFEEDYGVALPARHPLAERESVAAEEIAGEAMIVRRHCEALPAVSQHFTSRGVRPFMAARTAHDDRALAYVRAGLGITVMPRCFAGEGVAMPRLSGFDQRRRIGFLVDDASLRRIADMASYRILGETLARLASPT